MKTDELIDLLARSAGPAPAPAFTRRLPLALGLGLAAALALGGGVLGWIAPALWALPAPWFKLLYGALLAAVALGAMRRLGRPGMALGPTAPAALLVWAGVALVGVAGWLATPPARRTAALLGHSWWQCPMLVLALALPALAGLLWAMRGSAPTRPALSGLAAGLAAGAVGAVGYAFACTELGLPFVAVWYTAGILATGVLGAALGPRVLRW